MKNEEQKRRQIGKLADEIETEMRLVAWDPDPPTEEKVLAGGAFGLGTVAFDTWLQVVFLKRLREVAAGEMAMPTESSVAGRKGMGRGPSAGSAVRLDLKSR